MRRRVLDLEDLKFKTDEYGTFCFDHDSADIQYPYFERLVRSN
jgi:hypothetical protein